MENNVRRAIYPKENLLVDILCNEFGLEIVFKALKYQDHYQILGKCSPVLLSDIFNILSYEWQAGKAKEYFESLEEWIRCCLICCLVEDYAGNKSCFNCRLLESKPQPEKSL